MRIEHGVPMDDSNQISSLSKVDDTSKMQSNSSFTDHIQKPNADSSYLSAKFTEKTGGSTYESKRNSWGRTSVSLIVIHIILCIRISVILQFG
jgi:hypothetical protein